jgi:UDP-N-acetylmuramate--alanine ligase
MRLYFSGAGGVGIGPLAMIADDCGWQVIGSDLCYSLMIKELESKSIKINIGDQDGGHLRSMHEESPIDYFIYSSALKNDSVELVVAKELNIKTAKRSGLINLIIQNKDLLMIAVAGTHGKTTTTAMIVWVLVNLNIPVSYSIGSTINFGLSGRWQNGSQYFIYEADEYDKNFLNFNPHLSLITNIDYDHPDTYPTVDSYKSAFEQFKSQSNEVIELANEDVIPGIKLNGIHNRKNATLAIKAIQRMYKDVDLAKIIEIINNYPGTGRRMEKLAKNIFSDYAHTPEELGASMQMVREMYDTEKIVAIFQPHHNERQREIMASGGYADSLAGASRIYWLPTYLTREKYHEIIAPEELSGSLSNSGLSTISDMNDTLVTKLKTDYLNGSVIVFFGAGNIDSWARNNLFKIVT